MIVSTNKSYTIRFIEYLLLNSSFTNNIGLFDGKASVILYIYYTDPPLAEWKSNVAFSFLEETLGQINKYSPIYLGTGIAGVGVLLEHLNQAGFLNENTNDLLEESEPYLLSSIYFANLNDISLSKGISGIGLYLLHRMNAIPAANNFNLLRYKESIIACIDQINNIIRTDSFLLNDTILQGYSGVLLFVNKVLQLNCYNPLTYELFTTIINTLLKNLKKTDFSWQSAETWFTLLYCCKSSHPLLYKQILPSLTEYCYQAKSRAINIPFFDSAFTSLWFKLIFEMIDFDESLTISNRIKDHIFSVINKEQISNLFPLDEDTDSVPIGINKGVCGIALPLLSLETRNYRWLSTISIDIK